MKRIVMIILFLPLILFVPKSLALELCAMSEEYKMWLSLSDDEKRQTIMPAYCQASYKDAKKETPTLDESKYYYNIFNKTNNLGATPTQIRYNAVEDGYITVAKDQMLTNSCWAFTGVSLVETSAIKEGLTALDLSERHLEYSLTREAFTNGVKNDGFNRALDAGGNSYLASSYFFRHDGPISEASMPYQMYNTKIDINTMPNDKALLDISEYTVDYYAGASGCALNQIASIKEKIVKYGSVGASMYYDDAFIKNNKYYYNYASSIPNHAVTIVGWDDSILASSFLGNPSSNGAWIVKNSWGPNWGINGLFYISYSDMRVCNNISTYSGIKINNYDNTYYAADTLANFSFTNPNGNLYLSTKFAKKSTGKEYLDKVSVELNAGNTYEVYLSLTNNLTDQKTWQKLGGGYTDISGVKSFTFDPIEINEDYTIIVKYVIGQFPMMCKTLTNDMHYYMDITSNRNYYSFGGSSWADLKTASDSSYSGCEPVIYAYTTNFDRGNVAFNINSIVGSSNKVYAYTNDYFTVNMTSTNVLSYDLFKIRILNNTGNNVTNLFSINKDIKNGKVTIKPVNSMAGEYTFELSYGNDYKTAKFNVLPVITSDEYVIDDDYIYINLKTLKELTKEMFLKNINIYSSTYSLLNAKGTEVVDTSLVGTGSTVNIGNKKYIVVLKGDVSGDGKILGNDSLLISRYLVKLDNLTKHAAYAADISGDGKILGNDSLVISRFLVGLNDSL